MLIKSRTPFNHSDWEKCIKAGWKQTYFESQKALTNGKVVFVPNFRKKRF